MRKSKIKDNLKTGMSYQRGIHVATRCFREGLPMLLTDSEVKDLNTCLSCLEQQQLADKTYFGNSEILIADYIKKLQTVYSNPETIRNGLQALEKIYGESVITGSDFLESRYWDQIEKVDYFKTRGKKK